MKKLLLLFTLIISTFIGVHPAFADTTRGYIGVDLSGADISSYEKILGITAYKVVNTSTVNTLLNEKTATQALDGVYVVGGNDLVVNIVKNNDPGIDTLGYTDLLLTLGITQGNISVINNNTTESVGIIVQAYHDLGITIDPANIALFKQEEELYSSLQTETKNISITSQILYNIQQGSTSLPDTKLSTKVIVDNAIKDSNASLSTIMTTRLYIWAYNIVNQGNQSTGFFRTLSEHSNQGIITIVSGKLHSAPAPSSDYTNVRKVVGLCIFILLIVIIGILIYKRKKKLTKKNIS